jgi:hypothetical protein
MSLAVGFNPRILDDKSPLVASATTDKKRVSKSNWVRPDAILRFVDDPRDARAEELPGPEGRPVIATTVRSWLRAFEITGEVRGTGRHAFAPLPTLSQRERVKYVGPSGLTPSLPLWVLTSLTPT